MVITELTASCCEYDKLKISFTGHNPREDAVATLDLLRKTVIDLYPDLVSKVKKLLVRWLYSHKCSECGDF